MISGRQTNISKISRRVFFSFTWIFVALTPCEAISVLVAAYSFNEGSGTTVGALGSFAIVGTSVNSLVTVRIDGYLVRNRECD